MSRAWCSFPGIFGKMDTTRLVSDLDRLYFVAWKYGLAPLPRGVWSSDTIIDEI